MGHKGGTLNNRKLLLEIISHENEFLDLLPLTGEYMIENGCFKKEKNF